jgi:hypothetical protein
MLTWIRMSSIVLDLEVVLCYGCSKLLSGEVSCLTQERVQGKNLVISPSIKKI